VANERMRAKLLYESAGTGGRGRSVRGKIDTFGRDGVISAFLRADERRSAEARIRRWPIF
jgi:hypothetical protein